MRKKKREEEIYYGKGEGSEGKTPGPLINFASTSRPGSPLSILIFEYTLFFYTWTYNTLKLFINRCYSLLTIHKFISFLNGAFSITDLSVSLYQYEPLKTNNYGFRVLEEGLYSPLKCILSTYLNPWTFCVSRRLFNLDSRLFLFAVRSSNFRATAPDIQL